MNRIEFGDCRETMRRWAAEGVRVHTCVTSPPYFGLRDYGHEGQLGLEETPEEYIAAMVEVFRCVWDVLDDDGTLWLNIGDSYAANRGHQVEQTKGGKKHGTAQAAGGRAQKASDYGVKPKDLIGIPWMLAFALRADGWYLRQEIIWHKPSPMPESVRDRCTKAHESIFLLAKSPRYYFDSEAIREPAAKSSVSRWAQDVANQRGSDRVPGKTNGAMRAVGGPHSKSRRNSFARETKDTKGEHGQKPQFRPDREPVDYGTETRNRRSVWTVATKPYSGAHFATFPPALIEPCILAGSRPGDVVLDPFMGSGTTAAVAIEHGRRYLGCEINTEYAALQEERIGAAEMRREVATAQRDLFLPAGVAAGVSP